MTELSKVQIIKAAKELNNVLGLKNDDGTPGIKTGGGATKEQISTKIIEAGAFIDPINDEFTDETWEALEGLGAAHRVIDELVLTKISIVKEEPVKEEPVKEENISTDEDPGTEESTVTVIEEKDIQEIQEDFVDEENKVPPVARIDQESLSKCLDDLLEQAQDFDEIVKIMKELSITRGLKVFQTPGSVRAHIRYRIKGGSTFPVDYLK